MVYVPRLHCRLANTRRASCAHSLGVGYLFYHKCVAGCGVCRSDDSVCGVLVSSENTDLFWGALGASRDSDAAGAKSGIIAPDMRWLDGLICRLMSFYPVIWVAGSVVGKGDLVSGV